MKPRGGWGVATPVLVDVICYLRTVREKSIGVWDGTSVKPVIRPDGTTEQVHAWVWIPRSQCGWQYLNMAAGRVRLRLPEHIARDRGLIGGPLASTRRVST